jgi:hypothetical protein
LSYESLTKLDDIRNAIHSNPVFSADGITAHINFKDLSSEELSKIFSAAHIPLTICLCAEVQQS